MLHQNIITNIHLVYLSRTENIYIAGTQNKIPLLLNPYM